MEQMIDLESRSIAENRRNFERNLGFQEVSSKLKMHLFKTFIKTYKGHTKFINQSHKKMDFYQKATTKPGKLHQQQLF